MSSSTSSASAAPYFDFRSAKRVPETHLWSDQQNYPTVEAIGPDAVPVVDMTGDPDVVAQAVACAAREWGGFLLVGHGVPTEAVARMQEQIGHLFALPASEKTSASRPPGASYGYGMPPYAIHFDKLMWSEGYTFPTANVRSEFRRVWPNGGDDYLRFCEVVEEYHREMSALGGRLLDMFFRALGLTDHQISTGEMERKIRDTLTATMHLNLYPKCPNPERAMGLAAHTDSGFFTFIMQSPVPGLQLHRHAPHRWVTVPALPGAFAVVIADLFQLLTNGRFQSVLHRAVVNSECERISVPYILGPPADMIVAPLASAMLPGTKAVFQAVTWPEYMVVREAAFETDKSALNMLQIEQERGGEP